MEPALDAKVKPPEGGLHLALHGITLFQTLINLSILTYTFRRSSAPSLRQKCSFAPIKKSEIF
jgi:hypothetical protein